MAFHRRAARRLRRHGRPRHGRRLAPAVPRQGRQRAPRDDQLRRSALGRQPGLAHHRRRRHVRRLADDVRYGVLRLLLGDARPADGPHLPSRRLRLPLQGGRHEVAHDVGLAPVPRLRHPAGDLRRCLRQPAAGRSVPHRRNDASDLHGLVLRPAESVRPALRRALARHDRGPRRQLPDASH